MTRKEPHSMEHRIEQTQGVVWMALSAILAVQLNLIDSATRPSIFLLTAAMACLAYIAFVINTTKTSRYSLPILRAFGKEDWNYYHEPLEGAA